MTPIQTYSFEMQAKSLFHRQNFGIVDQVRRLIPFRNFQRTPGVRVCCIGPATVIERV
jgi:hypothetical protein